MARVIGGGLDTYMQREARERALNIVMEAREKAATIVAQAEQEAAAHKDQELARARARLEARKRQAFAHARLEAKRLVTSRQEEFLEELFTQAQERLEQLDPQQRLRSIERLIADAVEQLGGGELEIELAPRDVGLVTAEVLQSLQQQLADKGASCITLGGQRDDIWGGVVVRRRGSQQFVDNSFNARLALAKATLRDEIASILAPSQYASPAATTTTSDEGRV